MARADTITKLALDEYATIIGLNPFHFNGFYSNTYFKNNACGEVFFQYDWQHSDRIGRDTIAMAIRQAEDAMEAEAGFFLMPTWVTEERLTYPQPGRPGVFGLDGLNPRGLYKSVEVRHAHVISGGLKTKTLIQAVAAVVRSDVDGDGYSETATVTVPVTFTDIDHVRVYYAGMSGDDAWEIRPATVTISGGFATITFKSWQIPDHNKLEYANPDPIDGDLAASYETTVDVYRVYNDPSTQLQFMWENSDAVTNCCGTCVACQLSTQAGCFHLRDQRLGIIVPAPGSWNATDEAFDSSEFSACRDPDQVRVWYVSGWKDDSVKRPYVEMSRTWRYAVAYYASSLFDRPVCGCSNVKEFIQKWRRDAAFSSLQEGGFNVTAELMSNKLGTTLGALMAYKVIHSFGRRVIK